MEAAMPPSPDRSVPSGYVDEDQEEELGQISASHFYAEYHGHKVKHLRIAYTSLAADPRRSLVFLVGDSSLDNKHWFFYPLMEKTNPHQMQNPTFTDQALNGYERFLRPPRMVQDVCYWLNHAVLMATSRTSSLAHGTERKHTKVPSVSTVARSSTSMGSKSTSTDPSIITSMDSTNSMSMDPTNSTSMGPTDPANTTLMTSTSTSTGPRTSATPIDAPPPLAVLNTAIEESLLGERRRGLRVQDTFVRDHLRPQDILVVSVGGNDIALRPSVATIVSMASLMLLTPMSALRKYEWGPGLGHFIHLFRTDMQRYIEKLTAKALPRKILLCMIYYPCEKPGNGWAEPVLKTLGYNTNPEKLQLLIRLVYEKAIKQVKVPGSEVVPVPLFEVLDPKDPRDYVERVEPSVRGGKKMAEYMYNCIMATTSAGEATSSRQSAM